MNTPRRQFGAPEASPAPATLWDLFQSLQELAPDEETVLLAVDDLLGRGLVRWAQGRPPTVTLH